MAINQMIMGRPVGITIPIESVGYPLQTYPGPDQGGAYECFEVTVKNSRIVGQVVHIASAVNNGTIISDVTLEVGSTTRNFTNCFLPKIDLRGPIVLIVVAYQEMR